MPPAPSSLWVVSISVRGLCRSSAPYRPRVLGLRAPELPSTKSKGGFMGPSFVITGYIWSIKGFLLRAHTKGP